MTQLFLDVIDIPPWQCLDLVFKLVDQAFNIFENSNKIQKLLSSKDHFDMVMTQFFVGQEFILYLGQIFKAPVVGLQAFATNNVVNSVFGNDLSISYIPDVCMSFSNRMNLYERTINTISVLRGLSHIYYQKYYSQVELNLMKMFPSAPSLWDLINNVSFIFINDHQTADYAQPRPPNIIPVGGIHIKEGKQLPPVSPLIVFIILRDH